jgi:hypothetical protein
VTTAPPSIDIGHWIGRADTFRTADGGYTYESLAMAMVIDLGWAAPAALAKAMEPLVSGWAAAYGQEFTRDPLAEHATRLYGHLGWPQSALFVAWFGNLDNMRMAREDLRK